MKYTSLFKTFLFGLIAVFAISCDKDFNEIGADFVDNDHYTFQTATYPVKAHNQRFDAVQTNNLPINALGFYKNPVFGKTNAGFVTQLELGTASPTFIKSPSLIEVDSVYLHVPYFSKLTAVDASGNGTYNLDSIYGSGKIKLEVFRSNYYLRNLGPNPVTGALETQNYFSNQKSDIESVTSTATANRLNKTTAPSTQNDDFEFSNAEIKFYKTDGVTVRERLVPGIYMDLKENYFRDEIIRAATANLADNNAFKNYFRGLYFKVTPHASNLDGAALSMLNFAQGKIVIVYKDNKSTTDATQVRKTLTLNMKGFTVNLLENTPSGTPENNDYTTALQTADQTNGDPKLYLKGGAGSMAILDLFGGATNDGSVDLNTMRNERWLINEANLVFNIDNNVMAANDISLEPNRIYLYDFNNKKPLIDYYFDTSTFQNPKFNKLIHSGIIQKVSTSARGTKYKIRITNHIRSLVQNGGATVTKDSTNVRLGLVVTESINSVVSYKAINPFPYLSENAKFVPAMSIVNPLGTVLYGGTTSVPDNVRLKLEIVYTKPD